MSEKRKNAFHRYTQEEINALPGHELKAKRTRASKTYALGNGLYQSVIYPEDIHFRNERGEWEDIDHTLKQENGALSDHSGDLSVRLAPGGCVTLKKGAHQLSWQMIGAAPAEAMGENAKAKYPRHSSKLRTENRVTYSNIFPDVDFVCDLAPNHFKDTLVFKTPAALRPVDFLIHAENLILRQDPSGDVVAMCGNETIFQLPAPSVINERGDSVPGSATAVLTQVSDSDWHWVCAVDAQFAATATYPIMLDPVVKTQRSTSVMSMAYTSSAKPTTNYPGNGYSVRIANNSPTYGKCSAYLKFAYEPDDPANSALPIIDSSYYVTSATLTMRTAYSGDSTPVYIKEVLSEWQQTQLTHNNQPTVSGDALEYYVAPASADKYLYFNITNLVRKWYNGTNHGLMLETLTGGTVQLCGAGAVYAKPYITITYVSLAGMESYLVQDSISCGRAGTAHVGLFNGNLVLSHQETAMNGNLAPVSIGRYYNSCYRNANPFGVGKGWQLSVHQTLHKETIDSTTYYVYMDGDGTRHHFKQSSGKWKDLSGLELTLTIENNCATITDKANNKMVFDVPTSEFNDNYANAKLVKSTSDALGVGATFSYGANGLLNGVTDGAARTTNVTSANGLIGSIQAPGMAAVSYTYENAMLTSIVHPDGKTTTYGYNAKGLLESIVNHDNTAILIAYHSKEPYRVAMVVQLANRKIYAARKYTYGDCCTTVTELIPTAATQSTALSALRAELVNPDTMFVNHQTDPNAGKSIHYHFNDAGNLVSVNDEAGYGCFAGYSDEVPTNHPAFVSKMQCAVSNYLKNHHFLSSTSTDWTADLMDGSGECGYSSEMNYAGGRAYRLMKTSTAGTISVYQTITLNNSRSYTFSCQYKTLNNAKVQLKAEWHDANGNPVSALGPALSCTDRWNRTHVSFTLPETSSAQTVKVRIMATGGAGKVWVDAAQLEDGLVPNRYNLLQNANFYMNSSGQPTYWDYSDDVESTDGVTTNPAPGRPADLPGHVLRLKGSVGKTKYVYQEMSCIGSKGDTFVAGGWSYNHCCPRNGTIPVEYEMTILARPLPVEVGLSDSQIPSFRTVGHVMWSEEWSGWQFAATPVVMPWRYTAVQVRLGYRNNLNEAQFSNLFLHKEEFGKTYAYDEHGNVTSVKNLATLRSYATYDAFDNMTTYQQPGRGEEYTLDWGSSDPLKKQHLLRKTTSPLGIIQKTTYDVDDNANGKGLPVKTTVTGSTTNNEIITTVTYSSDKNYIRTQTNTRGKDVETTTNPNRGTVTSVKDPKGQSVYYEYDALNRVTKVSTTAGGKEYRNQYRYENDNLAEVRHNTSDSSANDVVYTFEYDAQNRRTKVKVGNTVLSENVYDDTATSSHGTLKKVKYGNANEVNYSYDPYKRLKSMQYGTAGAKFDYSYGANGQVSRVTNHGLNRTALSEYDSSNRPMRITHMEGGNHLYTGEVTYDAYNNLARFEETVGTGRTAYSTAFSYDAENKPTLLKYNNSDSNKVAYTYDALGRTQKRTVTVNGRAYESTYAYMAGGHGANSTTGLVAAISQPGGSFTYDYDDNGNIITVKQDDKTTSYTYDALGQLIRVDDGQENATWVYEYDQGGNILSKRKYGLGTTTGDPLESKVFSYGNANWRDQLTAVNGVTISYDAIGNPTNDGKWHYEWVNGRQLARIYNVDTDASFVYNENGLRVRKTVNGVVTNYTLHGKNIVHMTQGSNNLHFFYDAQNKPAIVEYNGTRYTYVHNLQGDIVAILDGNGTAVVQYKYDAWGRPISKTGSMAGTLGTVQPFRYRGYVYDEETGLYYLRSRYYSPIEYRFINPDLLINKSSNLSLNQYTYCLNNPINSYDPTGFATVDLQAESDLDIDGPYSEWNAGSSGPQSFAGHAAIPGTSVKTTFVRNNGRYNPNQSALVELAKSAEHSGGVTLSDAEILMEWCQEYNMSFHLDFGHPSRGGFIDQIWHVHIGPVNHLPITPVIFSN